MTLTTDYLFAGILLLISVIMGAAMVLVPPLVTKLLGLTRPNAQKLQPYECGITPTGSGRVRFSIKFYLVAMIFILFDIEAIFLYPWAVVHRWLGVFGLIEMGLFVLILLVGYVYIWRRGAFQWD
jgi:NADH-quinone oxidoreductase subunit A